MRLGRQGVDLLSGLDKKIFLLELRQKHLAMGCAVRCYSDFHLFDAQKLV